MVRKISIPCPEIPAQAENKGDTITRSYSIQVVTPLFGGGVEPGRNDPVTLIRGAGIRGHLRFWWRATRGASYESEKELRKKEEEIWGTAK